MSYQWILLFIISWLAATISGSAGFGGALILLPILNGFVGIKVAVPILTITQLLGNMSRAGFGFSEIRWRPVGLFILGALPAAIIGARLFVTLPKHNINMGIGILLIIIVILRRFKLFEFKIKELGYKVNSARVTRVEETQARTSFPKIKGSQKRRLKR